MGLRSAAAVAQLALPAAAAAPDNHSGAAAPYSPAGAAAAIALVAGADECWVPEPWVGGKPQACRFRITCCPPDRHQTMCYLAPDGATRFGQTQEIRRLGRATAPIRTFEV